MSSMNDLCRHQQNNVRITRVVLILTKRAIAECTCNTKAKYFWNSSEKNFEYFIFQANMYTPYMVGFIMLSMFGSEGL